MQEGLITVSKLKSQGVSNIRDWMVYLPNDDEANPICKDSCFRCGGLLYGNKCPSCGVVSK